MLVQEGDDLRNRNERRMMAEPLEDGPTDDEVLRIVYRQPKVVTDQCERWLRTLDAELLWMLPDVEGAEL